ncbi:helix-hairpin-helix domain-containing protein [Cohnella sp. WQ 127256]|uniref:ComEA family DNA-binding protein n=1 Tax=Cohnella sp. WQ 127256 TaxID=2938790 RepID=UPI002118AFBA|nr:helix-hairpin-helix domain-containing protein [Cohnella sp. WQ 127256]
MANVKNRNVKKLVILSMLLTGGALFVYSLFQGSAQSTIPGWTAVNEPLTTAIENLSTPQSTIPTERQSAALSPIPSVQQPPTLLPDSVPSQSAVPTANQGNNSSPSSNSKQPPEPASALSTEAATTASSTLLDLNHATQSQLETLPGIGPSKAKAIIAYREKQNGFQNINQLLEVKGIGAKVYDRISPLVQIPTKK